jgi:hypothetical protein
MGNCIPRRPAAPEPPAPPAPPRRPATPPPPSSDPDAPIGSRKELDWLIVLASVQPLDLFVNPDSTPARARQAALNAETDANVDAVTAHYIRTHRAIVD